MNTNVNFSAALGAVAFLGTGLILFGCALFLAYSLIARKSRLAKLAFASIALVAGMYFAVMLIFSFASRNKVLARGEEKHFCEIDCHIAYSIIGTRNVKTIDTGPKAATAAGMFTIVTIQTRFDGDTISEGRGKSPLYPNPRVLTVVDEQGRRYSPSTAGQEALESGLAAGTSITQPLIPGEHYQTMVAFDLPLDAKNLTLLLNESDWVTHIVIGHENSLLHKKTSFKL